MRRYRSLSAGVASLGAIVIAAFARQAPTAQTAPADPEVLLNLSEGLAIEYRADVFFRLSEAGKGPRQSERARILEALFMAAGQARQPLPLVGVVNFPYGRDGYVFAASSLRLDVLSLKCRVVRELRKADPAKARELFRQCYRDIRPPAAGCETSLVFDPSLLEITLENLLVGLRGDALAEELSDYAGAMVSGVQIPGFVRLLLENSAAPQDHGFLLRMSLLIAQRLRELEEGDRAFVYATGGLRLVEQVGELARQLRQSGMRSEVLVSSLRTYLRRHFTQERCADTPRNSPEWRAPREIADAFREVVRDAGVEIEPLSASEMQP